ncbi:MAG: BREX system ATP-binding domain-containing protein [Pseudohongiellaceae bacterium]
MNNFAAYGFTEIPFPIVPEQATKHWAGREELREKLIDIIESPRHSDVGLSEFVVLHGTYGAGKSHALRYLKNYIEKHKDNYRAQAVYIESIRIEDRITFLAIYKEIIRQLGGEYIQNVAKLVNNHIKLKEAESIKDKKNDDVLSKFDQELRGMLEQLRGIADGNNDPMDILLTKVKSDFEAARKLGAFFKCMQQCTDENERPLTEANYLFLDEVEATTEVKVVESQALFNALLQLVNQMPQNFCLICSFSGDTALLEAVVNEALLQRMSRDYIEVPDLEMEEAKEFLATLFEAYRPENFEHANRFHPFSEQTIDYVLDRTLPMTPRAIFKGLRRVLDRSVKRNNLQPGEEIQKDDAEDILS